MAHMQLEVEKEMKKKTANKNMVSACNVWQERHVHCVCRGNGVINSDTIMLNVWPLGTIWMNHIGYVKYL